MPPTSLSPSGLTPEFSRAHRLHLTCDKEPDNYAVGVGCNDLLDRWMRCPWPLPPSVKGALFEPDEDRQ